MAPVRYYFMFINMSHSLSELSIRLKRLLYPPGSGYRSETGGLMGALRVLTPDKGDDCAQTALASLILFQFVNTTRITTSLTIWLSSLLVNCPVEHHLYYVLPKNRLSPVLLVTVRIMVLLHQAGNGLL